MTPEVKSLVEELKSVSPKDRKKVSPADMLILSEDTHVLVYLHKRSTEYAGACILKGIWLQSYTCIVTDEEGRLQHKRVWL